MGFPQINLDVTFRVDDFSYKKLFHPSQYATVMPILLNSREILQLKSKFTFANFKNPQIMKGKKDMLKF